MNALLSESGACELAAEGDQPPGPALGIPAEADVGAQGVLVAEEALDRIAIVDAVGARQRVKVVYRLGAEPDREGHVPLEAELLLDRGHPPFARDPLGFEAIRSDREPRHVDLRPRCRDAELHGLEVAHAHGRVARAPRLDRLD